MGKIDIFRKRFVTFRKSCVMLPMLHIVQATANTRSGKVHSPTVQRGRCEALFWTG